MSQWPQCNYAGQQHQHAESQGGKVLAVLDGRFNQTYEDICRLALPLLRHRTILNFEAEAEEVQADSMIKEILQAVPQTAE
jgi:MoxR-like ATPase